MSCTITVTGATGNIGKVLSEILLGRGHKVRAVGRDAGRLQPLVDNGAEACVGDIADAAFLTTVYNGADAAFVMIPPDMTAPDADARAEIISKAHVAAIREAVPAIHLKAFTAIELAHFSKISGLHVREVIRQLIERQIVGGGFSKQVLEFVQHEICS